MYYTEVDLQPLPVYHFKKLSEGPFTLFEFNVKFKMKANNRMIRQAIY